MQLKTRTSVLGGDPVEGDPEVEALNSGQLDDLNAHGNIVVELKGFGGWGPDAAGLAGEVLRSSQDLPSQKNPAKTGYR